MLALQAYTCLFTIASFDARDIFRLQKEHLLRLRSKWVHSVLSVRHLEVMNFSSASRALIDYKEQVRWDRSE